MPTYEGLRLKILQYCDLAWQIIEKNSLSLRILQLSRITVGVV